jgi:serine/threonine protein kinase
MRGVLDVLAECHRRNICYGDVKPANFLLSTAEGDPTSPRAAGVPTLTVRAVDFGCSRAVAKGAPLTQQCGTPLYMAPEMAMQRFGLGVDVWAAGVMVSACKHSTRVQSVMTVLTAARQYHVHVAPHFCTQPAETSAALHKTLLMAVPASMATSHGY